MQMVKLKINPGNGQVDVDGPFIWIQVEEVLRFYHWHPLRAAGFQPEDEVWAVRLQGVVVCDSDIEGVKG